MSFTRSATTSVLFAKLVNPLLCAAIIIVFLYVGQEIFIPFAFSCLIALLLTGACRSLEKQGFPRAVAALVCVILALLVFVVVFYFISNSIISFREDLPLMLRNIDDSIHQLEVWIQKTFHMSRREVKQIVENSTDKVIPSTSSIVNTTVNTVTAM